MREIVLREMFPVNLFKRFFTYLLVLVLTQGNYNRNNWARISKRAEEYVGRNSLLMNQYKRENMHDKIRVCESEKHFP